MKKVFLLSLAAVFTVAGLFMFTNSKDTCRVGTYRQVGSDVMACRQAKNGNVYQEKIGIADSDEIIMLYTGRAANQ